ncbi:solute carrier family 23 member 1-like [Babylonia areolata]|uniref:solute carrier family 23 member 1-like n=1 Tax=Babylonia areolata TaxID=304850 RepID=UPI003FD2A49D
MMYTLRDRVPLPMCLLLGFQNFLMAVISSASLPLLLTEPLCMTGDSAAVTELVGANLVAAGAATLLQTTFGVRLPIVQGPSASYIVPILSVLSQPQWRCPATALTSRDTDVTANVTKPALLYALAVQGGNDSILVEAGSEAHKAIWLPRLREVTGAVMLASMLQVALGLSGVLGVVLRYVGPLSVAPTVVLIGLGLGDTAAAKASHQWWIALLTAALVLVFSQCLNEVSIPVFCSLRRNPAVDRREGNRLCCSSPSYRLPIFKLFPVLLGILVTWMISFLLTVTDVLPAGNNARTDVNYDVLSDAAWFHVPYPGQRGLPTVSAGAVLGVMAGVMASVVESVGDYYACAQLSAAPPPPPHAINRGIATEGIACVVGTSLGTAFGVTSYSQNIAAIGVTRVASRRVVLVTGMLMMLFGCVGKVGALFVTITDPILGGLFIVLFGMITAVGLSQLRSVDLRLGRNQTVVGLSLFLGLCVPRWVATHKDAFSSGSQVVDQVLRILLSTGMFVGGAIGFVLDNLLPGTKEMRGMMRPVAEEAGDDTGERTQVKALEREVYGVLPLLHALTRRFPLLGRLPFCPPPPPPV